MCAWVSEWVSEQVSEHVSLWVSETVSQWLSQLAVMIVRIVVNYLLYISMLTVLLDIAPHTDMLPYLSITTTRNQQISQVKKVFPVMFTQKNRSRKNIQWNLRWETTALTDWPPMRHCCSNMALHFYTFEPVMKDHMSHKTQDFLWSCGVVSHHRFHCISCHLHWTK